MRYNKKEHVQKGMESTAIDNFPNIKRFIRCSSILLAIIVAIIPGILSIMRRADAQVALGNAKSLRMAIDSATTELYGSGLPFCDPSSVGGVTEEVWRQVITDSKVPGDFWVLQMDKTGCQVQRFCYQEGDFSVTYCREPLTYEVFYQQEYIRTKKR